MAARSKEVRQLTLADLGVDRGQPAETVVGLADAETRSAGEIVEDDGSSGVDRIMAVLAAARVV
jgi:electron transfer flavoprotein alpha/beta subunit